MSLLGPNGRPLNGVNPDPALREPEPLAGTSFGALVVFDQQGHALVWPLTADEVATGPMWNDERKEEEQVVFARSGLKYRDQTGKPAWLLIPATDAVGWLADILREAGQPVPGAPSLVGHTDDAEPEAPEPVVAEDEEPW